MSEIEPSLLRLYYRSFLKPRPPATRRILLTGHSHQAWPDVAREGLEEYFEDSAAWVDDKWERAFQVQDKLRQGIAARIGGSPSEYVFGQSCHELLVRLLSSLDLRRRPHIVTTSGEFHAAYRQLRRLGEEGIQVDFVECEPVDSLAARLAKALRPTSAMVLVSSVLFETSARVFGIAELADEAKRLGAALVVDAYHSFNVVPFVVEEFGPQAFVMAGGYKYAQWGEGVCFMRVPKETALRPAVTGWFAGFAQLSDRRTSAPTEYAEDGAWRFAGSTFDPASFYRARAVMQLFDEQELSVPRLRELSITQTEQIAQGLERAGFTLASPRDPKARGGFVSIRLEKAQSWVQALASQGIHTDSRGDLLRLGPAPYLTSDEIQTALSTMARLAKQA